MPSVDDFKDDKAVAQTVGSGSHNANGPLKTSYSTSGEPRLSLVTYSASDMMQGMALYKPPGATYDVFNRDLSNEMQDLGTEPLYTKRNDKLTPYDIFVADPDPSKLGNMGSMGQTSSATNLNPGQGGAAPGSSQAATGSIQELCGKLLNHPGVTFDPGQVKGQFQSAANGQPPACYGRPEPEPRLIGLVIAIADRFPIQISSWIRPQDAPDGHSGGFCIDIDGCDGSLGINGSDERSKKIVSTAIDIMDPSWSVGFGRGNRTSPLPDHPGKNCYDFNDNPNHVHIQLK